MKQQTLRQILAFWRRPPMLAVLAVELLVLLWAVWQAAAPPAPLSWTAAELTPVSSEPLQTDADGYLGAAEQPAVAEGYSGLLSTPALQLPSGHYRLTVEFKASYHSTDEATAPYLSFYTETPGTLQACNGIIDPTRTQQEFLIEVRHACPDAQVIFTSRGCEFFVGHVTLRYDLVYAWARAVLLLFGFLVLNAVLLRVLPGSPLAVCAPARLAFALLAATVAFSSLLLLQNGNFSGHDWLFHLSRIEFIADTLRDGQFPVRVYTSARNGFGYGTPLFYGQLLLYIPALLRLLGFTVQQAMYAYMWGVNAATVGICYVCLHKIFGRRGLAVAGTMLYSLCWYRLYCLYTRTAVGEYTAMLFLPVLAYGLWRLYGPDGQARRSAWLPLMLAFTGFVQTHMLSLLMGAAAALLVGLLHPRRTFSPTGLLTWGKAAVGCVLLNAWFLVPFLSARQGSLPGSGANPAGEALAVDQLVVNGSSEALGLALLPGAVLFIGLCLWQRRPSPLRKLGATALAVGLAACWLATDLCPWAGLQESVIGPIIQSLQFPWRWLGIASLAFVLVTLCAAAELLEVRGPSLALPAMLLPVGLTLVLAAAYFQPLTVPNDTLQPMVDGSQTTYWTDDLYLPQGAVPEMRGFVHDDPVNLTVRSLTRADGVVTLDCAAAGSEGVIELPLLDYPGYRVLSGQGTLTHSPHGLVQLVVPSDWDGVITVGYREPKRWLLADAVSLLTAAGLLVWRRRRVH